MSSTHIAVAPLYVIEVDPFTEKNGENAPRTDLHFHYTFGT